jgi:hypothetical protein
MQDRPNGADLLDVARSSLLEEVAPALKGQSRYIVLMVANAMGIAAREINEADRAQRAWDAVLARVANDPNASPDAKLVRLVKSIRSGQFDANSAFYDALMETVEVAARIWKPAKSLPG